MQRKLLAALWGACALIGFPQGALASTAVGMQGSSFTPKDIVVAVGEDVVWTNHDPIGHTVTAEDRSFDSSPDCGGYGAGPCIGQGESFTMKFDKPGRFPYFCKVHGGPGGAGMSGTVLVLPLAPPSGS